MKKRNDKSGRFEPTITDDVKKLIDIQLKAGRGTNGIIQWLADDYGLAFIYAYNVVRLRKRAILDKE